MSDDILSKMAGIMNTPDVPRMFTPPVSQTNPAKWTYQRLIEYINSFERNLDQEHEVGARLVSFGSTVTFHIQDIGYYGPDIITFYGINEHDEEIQLIQNISQLSVLLIAMKKLGGQPVRIGFKHIEKMEGDQS
jgi:hypothetical protein